MTALRLLDQLYQLFRAVKKKLTPTSAEFVSTFHRVENSAMRFSMQNKLLQVD